MTRRATGLLMLLLMVSSPLLVTAQGPAVPPAEVQDPLPETESLIVENTRNRTFRDLNEGLAGATDLVNQLIASADGLPGASMTLYADAVGPDGSHGRLTPWRQVGDEMWNIDQRAASTGDWGYGNIGPDGFYPTGASSLLLTSELDLRTGVNVSGAVRTPGVSLINEFQQEYDFWGLHQQFFGVNSLFYNLAPQPQYTLSFDHRHNLATSIQGGTVQPRDAVQVWVFTQEPQGVQDIAACTQNLPTRMWVGATQAVNPQDDNGFPRCTIINPVQGGYDFDGAASMTNTQGNSVYSGSSGGWQDTLVDLSPWAERRIWVGFRFVSQDPIGTRESYFTSPAFFLEEENHGFHLDNLVLQTPASASRVQVREIAQPSLRPDPEGNVTLNPTKPFYVLTHLRNTGRTTAEVQVTVDLIDLGSGITTHPASHYLRQHPVVQLEPGDVVEVREDFEAIGREGRFMARIEARLIDPVTHAADDDGVDMQVLPIDMQFLPRIRFDPLEYSAATVDPGEPHRVATTVRNTGNTIQDVSLEARLIDVNDPEKDVNHLIQGGPSVTIEGLPPGASKDIVFSLDTNTRGQYRLFLRTSDQEPFSLQDLERPSAAPVVSVPYLPATVDLDGGLDDDAWRSAPPTQGTLRGPDGATRAFTMAAFHDGSHLHVGLTYADATLDDTTDFLDNDLLEVYFDDLQDWRMQDGGEDGVLHNGSQPRGGAPDWHDLHFNGTSLGWDAEEENRGSVERLFDATEGSWSYEITRPLQDGAGLTVGPGGRLGFMVAATQGEGTVNDALGRYIFPATALEEDGITIIPPDGTLDDEVPTWGRMLLQPVATVQNVGDRGLSAGFGFGQSPPPLFYMETSEGCPKDWPMAQGAMANGNQWNCAFYAPEGRELIFEGVRPGTPCGTLPCPPYSSATINDGISDLFTPPISIGAVEDPYLIINHQFSTGMQIRDAILGTNAPNDLLAVLSIGWVSVQVLQPDGTWGPDLYLIPEQGYSTLESNGLTDPRLNKQFVQFGNNGGLCVNNPFQIGRITSPTQRLCGWWAPSGHHPGVRNFDPEDPESSDIYPRGRTFTGSTWRVDPIPLSGTFSDDVDGFGQPQGGAVHDVSVENQVVRFHFTFDRGENRNSLGTADLGWRLGGLAVVDGDQFVSNLATTGAQITTPYDMDRLGLGPGTDVPIQVEVVNNGRLPSPQTVVRVQALDVNQAPPIQICVNETVLPRQLATGDVQAVTVHCSIPAGGAFEGGLFKAFATVVPDGGDDFPADDLFSIKEAVPIRASPNLALEAAVTPVSGSPQSGRSLLFEIHNQGNVPVKDFRISREVTLDSVPVGGYSSTWVAKGELGVGDTAEGLLDPVLSLSPAPNPADVLFDPPAAGEYVLSMSISDVPGDVDGADNVQRAVFRAEDLFYEDAFDSPPRAPVAGIIKGASDTSGTPDVWRIAADELDPNNKVLLAGDPATGEMPPMTDANYTLPPMDLTTLRQATLTFRHGYDLESTGDAGYDAARVEVSTDGGATWRVLRPGANPLGGLPEGYPSLRLIGANSFLGDQSELHASAFTGQSSDIPLSDDNGRFISEFPLGTDPGLSRSTPLYSFPLDGLAPTHDPASKDNDGTYGHETWFPPKELSPTPWRVEDVRTNDPKSLSGFKMWWSGTPGEFTADRIEYVATDLEIRHLDLSRPAGREDDLLYLTFWDWRPGWMDTDPTLIAVDTDTVVREGTGGRFLVQVKDEQGDVTTVQDEAVRAIDFRDDGWTRREVDLTPFRGQNVTVVFNYTAIPTAAFSSPRNADNQGWFLDDVAVTAYQLERGLRIQPDTSVFPLEALEDQPALLDCQAAEPFHVVRHRDVGPQVQDSITCWRLVERAEGPGPAWHIEPQEGPLGDTVPAWTIASDNDQGYPHNLNARLVTPTIDLSTLQGDRAHLTFDHQFFLEGDGGLDFVHALDGGVVEYQTIDPRTGRFGDWHQLSDGPFPEELVRRAAQGRGLSDLVFGSEEAFQATGYNAVYQASVRNFQSTGAPLDLLPSVCLQNPCGGNNPLVHAPVGYAFSGDSGGWITTEMDVSELIGHTVRFGFRAWSNPEFGGGASSERPGWSIANVAVGAAAFEGTEALIRLRVATDGSLLKDQWVIDDIEITGEQYERNLAIVPDGDPQVRVGPEEPVLLTGVIKNLGRLSRSSIALGISATEAGTGEPVPFELLSPAGLKPIDKSLISQFGYTEEDDPDVHGVFSLTPGHGNKAQVPLRIALNTSAEEGERIVVQARLLEDQGRQKFINGTLQFVSDFKRVRDQVLGNIEQVWTVSSQEVTEVELVEDAVTGFPITLDDASLGGNLTLKVRIENTGTTSPTYAGTWRLETLAGEELLQAQLEPGFLQRGSERVLSWHVAPPAPGSYRVLLHIDVEGQEGLDSALEFPVASVPVHWDEDFEDVVGFLPDGWNNPTDNPMPQIDFSAQRVDGFLSWGAAPGTGQSYDDTPGLLGLFGLVNSAHLDLTDALNDRANLVVKHALSFNRGDGAQFRATIVEQDEFGAWNPVPCDGAPVFVTLTPTSGFLQDARTNQFPANNNPLSANPIPVFQGPAGTLSSPVLTMFDLREQPEWVCPADQDDPVRSLVGQTISLQLRTGVANRGGGTGWQIDTLTATAGGVDVGPRSPGAQLDRVLPLERGTSKTVFVDVTNLGSGVDTFRLLPDNDAGASTWLEPLVPQVTLRPGHTATLPLRVNVPDSGSEGSNVARLVVQSVIEPRIQNGLTFGLDVVSGSRPDLVAGPLTAEATAGEGIFEQGRVVPVHLTVMNNGRQESKPVNVVFEMVDSDGTSVAFDTQRLPEICPLEACGGQGSRTSVTAEWAVPDMVGEYEIRARIDPESRLLEETVSNNLRSAPARVVPLQLPDLVVASLEVEGLDSRGLITEGTLMNIVARVRNEGSREIQDARVLIFAGSAELTEANIVGLQPDEEVEVVAVKAAAAGPSGEIVLRATGSVSDGSELRVDNNELSRIVRVRNHELAVAVETANHTLSAKDSIVVPFHVTNAGNSVERVLVELVGLDGSWASSVLPNPVVVPPQGEAAGILLVAASEHTMAGMHGMDLRVRSVANPNEIATTPLSLFVAEALGAPAVTSSPADVQPGLATVKVVLQSTSNRDDNVTAQVADPAWQPVEDGRVLLPAFAEAVLSVPIQVPPLPAGSYTFPVHIAQEAGAWAVEHHVQVEVKPLLRGHAKVSGWSQGQAEDLDAKLVVTHIAVNNTGNVPFRVRIQPIDLGQGIEATLVESGVVEAGDRHIMNYPVHVPLSTHAVQGALEVWLLPADGEPAKAATLPLPDAPQAPDLVIDHLDIGPGQKLVVHRELPVSLRIRNNGVQATEPDRFFVYVDGQLLRANQVPALAPQAVVETSFTVVPTQPGEHVLTVVLGSDAHADEFRADNNGVSRVLVVEKEGVLDRATPAPISTLGAGVLVALALVLRRSRRWRE